MVGTSTTMCTLVLWFSLASSFSIVEGVDRSKFRTCAQTSFCRRHREVKPSRSKTYKLKKSSVQFIFNDKDDDRKNDADANDDTKNKKGIWKSLFGSKDDGEGKNEYLGPTPVLRGVLTTLDETEELQLNIHLQEDGVARLRIKETDEFVSRLENIQKPEPRWTSDDLVLKNETMVKAEHVTYVPSTETDVLTSFIERIPGQSEIDTSHFFALQYNNVYTILVRTDSFQVHMFDDSFTDKDAPIVSLNTQALMHFEQRRSHKNSDVNHAPRSHREELLENEEVQREAQEMPDNEDKKIVGYWEDGKAIYEDGSRDDVPRLEAVEESPQDEKGLWDEKFGSHHDSKPYGPMSVGMDISFPQSQHLFGIPEHASKTLLQTTRGSNAHYKEPYRLYNLDVFEYELDETMALYGSIPFLVSHRVSPSSDLKSSTTGVFWMNPTEAFIDVFDTDEAGGKATHWMSESGIIDVFLLPGGDSPAKVYKQYASLTGYPYLPPLFSLGYHQCRWNYRDEADVYAVHANFEKYDYPYDVLWLDIEHTDGKRYFTWDKHNFPNPANMQHKLKSQGRNMVTIVDPHIKRDNSYYVHKEASSKKMYIKDKDGKDFDGWCWPGSSSYPDFTSARVREWWASQFAYSNYIGSTPSLYTWNDMNEPSVFNGPEVSMQKDTVNLDGVEHREWHNLYGMTFHRATAEGLVARNKEPNRPFVLSRSFFAGSQQYGPIWTGDNTAQWGHLEVASKMLLSLNIAGLPFVGADVGGFFGDPDSELLVRWNQAAAYQPFFRGHAHHDSKRREPWVFGQETLELLRKAAMARYALLPFWYTVFWNASVTGMPIMRPMWMEYPLETRMFGLDDQYLIGSDLLVKPITGADETETHVVFPVGTSWYDVDNLERVLIDSTEPTKIEAGLDKIPVFQRGGSIVPRKLRLRRSASLMYNDPYTLYVALNDEGRANGILYIDDENSFKYESGEYGVASFDAHLPVDGSSGRLSNVVKFGKSGFLNEKAIVERIIIMGVSVAPSVLSAGDKKLTSHHNVQSRVLVIRKPELSALKDWSIKFEF